MFKPLHFLVIPLILFCTYSIFAQQISIPRIDMMPNQPFPYEMRDWKKVTSEYDDFIFDFNRTDAFGYLPLIWWRSNLVNYPEHSSFGLHTVVGTNYPNSSEAINLIPAVVSASLVGIDKSDQNGENWVLMCEEYFNKANGANVYRNHPTGGDWNDWWYDTMPNVFFYQLYSLYPDIGDFSYQFSSVADRWLAAVDTMGGNTTPWNVPYMNYRAFNLMTMTPFDSGVREPEAAGALAWLLYHAYQETGMVIYRVGAEWCMEFLNGLSSNPSYELQLAYGAYIAARMNAELYTSYDTEKIVNWCFNVGPLRNWGAIVGNWGGYDCSGLIGEVNGSNDYAFLMNTFEQVGALVPLVRYDERFARAIGKWVLNVANAARLLYSNYLPPENQDGEWWSYEYDTTAVIAHEAIRQIDPHNAAVSPFATGDAVTGGWGKTNFTLYGSSHVGIFGGIIDTTNVAKILKLDVLKTDYFHSPTYPSFLFYNPYLVDTAIVLDVSPSQQDLYEAISNTFLQQNVSGEAFITIPADDAIMIVITPSGGMISYELDQMLIDGRVVDYHSGQIVTNYPPRIKSLAAKSEIVIKSQNINIYCTAIDREDMTLQYSWSVSGGIISGTDAVVQWTAPDTAGYYDIFCLITDSGGENDSAALRIEVVQSINHDPVITGMEAAPRKIDLGLSSSLTCWASDEDGDSLSYLWESNFGTIVDSGSTAVWTAPNVEGNYYIRCTVNDSRNGIYTDSIGVVVRDFSNFKTGKLVAFYPFRGNANDESGNNHHGTVNGAILVPDRFGNPNSAYNFDGANDHIRVPNHDSLNVGQAITINFWLNVDVLYDRESFPISHASYENRWKVSFIPEKKLRWTIKTTTGIKDLDTEIIFNTGEWYNITVFYDGADFEIYVNGELNSFSSWSGLILPTTIDLTIGQRLPNDANYNFKGTIDDIRIYNYGLSVEEIENLANPTSHLETISHDRLPDRFILRQNYPNPFNPQTTIEFSLPVTSLVKLKIYDTLGREVASLLDEELSPGVYKIMWDSSNMASGIYFYTLRTKDWIKTKKMMLIR